MIFRRRKSKRLGTKKKKKQWKKPKQSIAHKAAIIQWPSPRWRHMDGKGRTNERGIRPIGTGHVVQHGGTRGLRKVAYRFSLQSSPHAFARGGIESDGREMGRQQRANYRRAQHHRLIFYFIFLHSI
ncbi:hypothetical protein EUGRSUZ_F00080 [Eucalyptus grandis]|uniref:Uncharacterized protein n=2 Tax=Eucalyptus grandis TaxID=71139 RepID=A0ACC3KBL8_EUCGR|nr:hypothetical protein EUGRSUZ_F00080 [Eucalyptus grandis]